MVFEQWRINRIIAKIYPENQRSVRCVSSCGFIPLNTDGKLHIYHLTKQAYLNNK